MLAAFALPSVPARSAIPTLPATVVAFTTASGNRFVRGRFKPIDIGRGAKLEARGPGSKLARIPRALDGTLGG